MAREPISPAKILKPESVAVIGASEDPLKFGGRIMQNVVRHGYSGCLLPINPARTSILGHKAYPSIAAAPGPVDIALIAVPAAQLLATVEECGKAGVGACIVITAQLGEFDAAGAALQDKVVAAARAHGMRLVGPNCMGLISATHALGLTSSPTLQYAERLIPGHVGFVSQSGALMGTLFAYALDHNVGLTSMISVGNQADLDLVDFYEALVDDDETLVICLYVESVLSGPRFLATSRRAAARGKRVLAIKAGRTEQGVKLAMSHTASLAGGYEAFEAACRASGVVLFDDPESMILCAGVIAANPPLPKAGGVGMIVASGGGGAIAADRMMRQSLPIAHWSEATAQALDRHFNRSHQNNPLDLGAHVGALSPEVFSSAIEAVFGDANTAAFVYVLTPQPLMPEVADALIACWRRQEKPVIVVFNTSRFAEPIRQKMLSAGMPFLPRLDDALRLLDILVGAARPTVDDSAASRPPGAGPAPTLREGYLTEPEAKALARAYGVATCREHVVRDLDAAREAAKDIGYPLVLKGVSRTIVHKSDAGLVRLGIGDAGQLAAAMADVAAALRAGGEAGEPAFLLQEQVRGEIEVIVGVRQDPVFGPFVLVGAGGRAVELERDIALAPAPITQDGAKALLRRLKLHARLEGFRGSPALDVDALADIAVRVSWLASDLGSGLQDFELNPVMVLEKGHGAKAVDARGQTLIG